MQPGSNVNAILATVVSLGVLAAVTALAWHGTIDGAAAVGIFGTVIGGGGAVVAHSMTRK